MKIPTLQGIIRRRILVNYRAEPEAIQKILPLRFRPKLHDGRAIAGICLIRLEHIRPKHAPEFVGISSENAAHRIAVLWEDETGKPKKEFTFRATIQIRLSITSPAARFFRANIMRLTFRLRKANAKLILQCGQKTELLK